MTYGSEEQAEEAAERFFNNSRNLVEILRIRYPRASWEEPTELPDLKGVEEPYLDLYGGFILSFTVAGVDVHIHSIVRTETAVDPEGMTRELSQYMGEAVLVVLQHA